MSVEWISRGECARRLGVSGTAVTNFCRLYGMPFRISDGKICWPDALYWSDLYRCPERSGSWYSLHRQYDRSLWERERQLRKLRRPDAEAWYRARQRGTDTTSVANRAIKRANRLSAAPIECYSS